MSWTGDPGRRGTVRPVRAALLLVLVALAYVAAVVGAALLWGWGGGLLVGGALAFEFFARADVL